MARRRPAGPGRARHRRAGHPDDRRRRLRRARSRRPSRASSRRCRAATSPAPAGRRSAPSSCCARSTRRRALADRIAAEHLEIATAIPKALAARIRNAGAIFLGAHTPEVIGDYVAGSNHVLPTARSARFSSGLGVLDFMKRTSILKLDAARARRPGARRHDARPRRGARGAPPLRRHPPRRRRRQGMRAAPCSSPPVRPQLQVAAHRHHARRGLDPARQRQHRARARGGDLRHPGEPTTSRSRAATTAPTRSTSSIVEDRLVFAVAPGRAATTPSRSCSRSRRCGAS